RAAMTALADRVHPWPFTVHQATAVQLALRAAGHNCRHILRTRVARPAPLAGFDHNAHAGGRSLDGVVPLMKTNLYTPPRRAGTAAGATITRRRDRIHSAPVKRSSEFTVKIPESAMGQACGFTARGRL